MSKIIERESGRFGLWICISRMFVGLGIMYNYKEPFYGRKKLHTLQIKIGWIQIIIDIYYKEKLL